MGSACACKRELLVAYLGGLLCLRITCGLLGLSGLGFGAGVSGAALTGAGGAGAVLNGGVARGMMLTRGLRTEINKQFSYDFINW